MHAEKYWMLQSGEYVAISGMTRAHIANVFKKLVTSFMKHYVSAQALRESIKALEVLRNAEEIARVEHKLFYLADCGLFEMLCLRYHNFEYLVARAAEGRFPIPYLLEEPAIGWEGFSKKVHQGVPWDVAYGRPLPASTQEA